jgi:MFS transporter, SHS family, lactate transporter
MIALTDNVIRALVSAPPTNNFSAVERCSALLWVSYQLLSMLTSTYVALGTTFRSMLTERTGGLYGNAAATALEDLPPEARGLMSGLLQQGYAFGYLLATAFARGLVGTTPYTWRPLYWFGACVPVIIIALRLCMGETDTYKHHVAARKERGNVGKTFIAEGRVALKRHWILLIYLVLLMAGFNFSQSCP